MRLASALLASLGLALASTAATGADPAAPRTPAPAGHDWTGPYAGFLLGSIPRGEEAFIGGGQVGYNLQLGLPVLGVEAGSYHTNRSLLSSLTVLRGRAGLAVDGTLVYGTFGLANLTTRAQVSYVPLGAGVDVIGGSQQSLFGLAAGGGVQTMISDSLSLRLDYTYARGNDYLVNGSLSGPRRSSLDTHVVGAGLDFHVDAWRMDYGSGALRPYLGGGASMVHHTGRGVEKYAAGAKAFGGVEVGGWAALEVSYLHLGAVAARDVRLHRSLDASAVAASALFFSDPLLPWLVPDDAPRARLFARAGGAYVMAGETDGALSRRDDGVAFNVGGGLQVDIDQVFVRAEYEYVSMVESRRIAGIRHTPLSVSAGIRF